MCVFLYKYRKLLGMLFKLMKLFGKMGRRLKKCTPADEVLIPHSRTFITLVWLFPLRKGSMGDAWR